MRGRVAERILSRSVDFVAFDLVFRLLFSSFHYLRSEVLFVRPPKVEDAKICDRSKMRKKREFILPSNQQRQVPRDHCQSPERRRRARSLGYPRSIAIELSARREQREDLKLVPNAHYGQSSGTETSSESG